MKPVCQIPEEVVCVFFQGTKNEKLLFFGSFFCFVKKKHPTLHLTLLHPFCQKQFLSSPFSGKISGNEFFLILVCMLTQQVPGNVFLVGMHSFDLVDALKEHLLTKLIALKIQRQEVLTSGVMWWWVIFLRKLVWPLCFYQKLHCQMLHLLAYPLAVPAIR